MLSQEQTTLIFPQTSPNTVILQQFIALCIKN